MVFTAYTPLHLISTCQLPVLILSNVSVLLPLLTAFLCSWYRWENKEVYVLMQFSCSPQSYSLLVLFSSEYWGKPCCERTQAVSWVLGWFFSSFEQKLIFGVNLRFRRLRFCLCKEQRQYRGVQFTLWCSQSGRGLVFFFQNPFWFAAVSCLINQQEQAGDYQVNEFRPPQYISL